MFACMHACTHACTHTRTHLQSTPAHNDISVWILDSNGDNSKTIEDVSHRLHANIALWLHLLAYISALLRLKSGRRCSSSSRSTMNLGIEALGGVYRPPTTSGRWRRARISVHIHSAFFMLAFISGLAWLSRSAAELRREDSLVTLPALEYYPCGAQQCCHLTDTVYSGGM